MTTLRKFQTEIEEIHTRELSKQRVVEKDSSDNALIASGRQPAIISKDNDSESIDDDSVSVCIHLS